MLCNGLLDSPTPPHPRCAVSEFSKHLRHLKDVEERGVAVPLLELLQLVTPQNCTNALLFGLPSLSCAHATVKEALRLSLGNPPEVRALDKHITDLLEPFDKETTQLLENLHEHSAKEALLAERSALQGRWLVDTRVFLARARASCRINGRTWGTEDCITGRVRTNDGAVVEFPVRQAPEVLQGGPDIPHSTISTQNDDGQHEDTGVAGESQVLAGGEENSGEAAMHVSPRIRPELQVAMDSSWTLLNAFAEDMVDYFAGRFITHRRKRGAQFGGKMHKLWPYLKSSGPDQSLWILDKRTWVSAVEACDADGECVQKTTVRFRTPRQADDEEQPLDMVCTTILQIIQSQQWSTAKSSAMLVNSLSEDEEEKTNQLSLVQQCFRTWLGVEFAEVAAVLCLLVVRSGGKSRTGLFQNQNEFWEFAL